MNLGNLSMAKLERLAKSAGISSEELVKALAKNKTLVARHGAALSEARFERV